MYQATKARIASTMTTIAAYLIAAYPTSPEPTGSRTSGECVCSSECAIRTSLVVTCIPGARRAQTWVTQTDQDGSRSLALAPVRRGLDQIEDGPLHFQLH